jgi:hypothetical protein
LGGGGARRHRKVADRRDLETILHLAQKVQVHDLADYSGADDTDT